jgi:hypothetical protein
LNFRARQRQRHARLWLWLRRLVDSGGSIHGCDRTRHGEHLIVWFVSRTVVYWNARSLEASWLHRQKKSESSHHHHKFCLRLSLIFESRSIETWLRGVTNQTSWVVCQSTVLDLFFKKDLFIFLFVLAAWFVVCDRRRHLHPPLSLLVCLEEKQRQKEFAISVSGNNKIILSYSYIMISSSCSSRFARIFEPLGFRIPRLQHKRYPS